MLNLQWKNKQNPSVFSWSLHRFARIPPRIFRLKMAQISMKSKRTSNFARLPPGKLASKFPPIFNEKHGKFQFFWFLQHFARLPPRMFSCAMLEYSMKNAENAIVFSWSQQHFARLPPSNCTWKKLHFSMKNKENTSVFFWFPQHFVRLPPSNLAWKTKTKKIHCFLLVSVSFC